MIRVCGRARRWHAALAARTAAHGCRAHGARGGDPRRRGHRRGDDLPARCAPVRVVTRDVSPRLGERVSAHCLELPVDASLEALTIVVPAGHDGVVVNFEIDASDRASAGAMRRRGIVCLPGRAQSLQLPADAELNAGLIWWAECRDDSDRGGILVASCRQPSSWLRAMCKPTRMSRSSQAE